MRQGDGMVIRKQVAQRAEPDLLRPQECLSDQQIGGRARLPGCGEVLSDPRLLEAECVEPLELIEIQTHAIPDAPHSGGCDGMSNAPSLHVNSLPCDESNEKQAIILMS